MIMISREKLLSEFNLNSVKETENANQLIRSFLKFSGFNMETEKIPSQLLKPLV